VEHERGDKSPPQGRIFGVPDHPGFADIVMPSAPLRVYQGK
jgi:hypothetical protein